jgi:sulfonate transport system substrate-binding protein
MSIHRKLGTSLFAFSSLFLAGSAGAADKVQSEVPPGVKIVLADDANNVANLLKLSGEQAKLSADVSFANFSSGPLRLEAIRAGAAEVGAVGDVPPILAQYSNADVVIVGAVVTSGPSTIFATAPGSGINQLSDLRGKRVAINVGTSQQATVLRDLRASGLTIADIKPINLGLAEFADALRSDQIDAAVLKQPDRARYLKSVAGTAAKDIPDAPGGSTNLKYLYASKTALEDPAKAAAIRDLVVHWYRAYAWKDKHIDVWISDYLVKDQRLSAEDAKVAADGDGTHSTIPGLTPQLIAIQQDTVDLLQSAGAFKGKPLKAEEEFDLRFADLNAASPTAREVGN